MIFNEDLAAEPFGRLTGIWSLKWPLSKHRTGRENVMADLIASSSSDLIELISSMLI